LLSHVSRERWLDGSFNASNLSSGAEICRTKKSSLSVFAGKILWIVALRREGEESRALRFLKLGVSCDAARADPCCKTDRKRDSPSRVDIGFDADAAGERRLARTKPCCDSSVKLG
jgi:hypothetical protein